MSEKRCLSLELESQQQQQQQKMMSGLFIASFLTDILTFGEPDSSSSSALGILSDCSRHLQ